MAPVKRKNKPFRFLTKDFFVSNQGDIFCTFLIIIVGCQYFTALREKTKMFVWIQYEVANNATNLFKGIPSLYGIGLQDYAIFISAMILFLVYICLLEENITDKYIGRLRLSLSKAYEFRMSVFSFPFHLAIISYGIYSLYQSEIHKTMDISNPVTLISPHYKLLIVFTIGFSVAMILKLFISKIKAMNLVSYSFLYFAYFLTVHLLYNTRMFHYSTMVISLNALIFLLRDISIFTGSISCFSFLRPITVKLHFFLLIAISVASICLSGIMIKAHIALFLKSNDVVSLLKIFCGIFSTFFHHLAISSSFIQYVKSLFVKKKTPVQIPKQSSKKVAEDPDIAQPSTKTSKQKNKNEVVKAKLKKK